MPDWKSPQKSIVNVRTRTMYKLYIVCVWGEETLVI